MRCLAVTFTLAVVLAIVVAVASTTSPHAALAQRADDVRQRLRGAAPSSSDSAAVQVQVQVQDDDNDNDEDEAPPTSDSEPGTVGVADDPPGDAHEILRLVKMSERKKHAHHDGDNDHDAHDDHDDDEGEGHSHGPKPVLSTDDAHLLVTGADEPSSSSSQTTVTAEEDDDDDDNEDVPDPTPILLQRDQPGAIGVADEPDPVAFGFATMTASGALKKRRFGGAPKRPRKSLKPTTAPTIYTPGDSLPPSVAPPPPGGPINPTTVNQVGFVMTPGRTITFGACTAQLQSGDLVIRNGAGRQVYRSPTDGRSASLTFSPSQGTFRFRDADGNVFLAPMAMETPNVLMAFDVSECVMMITTGDSRYYLWTSEGMSLPSSPFLRSQLVPSVAVRSLFWGKSWASRTFMADKASGAAANFRALQGSKYLAIQNQYFPSNTPAKVSFVDTIVDSAVNSVFTSSFAGQIAAIQTEICRAASLNPIPRSAAIPPSTKVFYAVYTDMPKPAEAVYCGFHFKGYCAGASPTGDFLFGFVFSSDDPNDPCAVRVAPPSGVTRSNQLQSMVVSMGHELFEAMTDPDGSGGWLTRRGGLENCDMCAGNVRLVTHADGSVWAQQSVWSNNDGQCVFE